jgi:hypothetical protein
VPDINLKPTFDYIEKAIIDNVSPYNYMNDSTVKQVSDMLKKYLEDLVPLPVLPEYKIECNVETQTMTITFPEDWFPNWLPMNQEGEVTSRNYYTYDIIVDEDFDETEK